MKDSYLGLKLSFRTSICMKELWKNMKPLSGNRQFINLDLNLWYFY